MMRFATVLLLCISVHLCTSQQVIVKPAEVKGEEGGNFTFSCESSDSDLDWFRILDNGTEVQLVSNSKYEVKGYINNNTSELKLTIKNAVPEDSGPYKCQLGQGGNSFTGTLLVHAIKDVVISPEAPEFIENTDLLLNCTVNGATDQEVTWTANKGNNEPEEFSGGDDASHIQVFNNGSLIIRGLTTADAGIYYCTHTFPQGTKYDMVSIGGDITLTAEKSVKYTEGDRALIVCEAHVLSSVLLPNITWLVNGTALEDSEVYKEGRAEVKITSETEHTITSQLELLKINMNDRMNYTCVATNGATETSKDILLRVRDRLAALWPFLGIVCEVIILIVIIFIHEKCSKGEDIGEDDEDDDDMKKEKQQMNDGDSMKMSSNQ